MVHFFISLVITYPALCQLGSTALIICLQTRLTGVARILIERGADLNHPNEVTMDYPYFSFSKGGYL